MSHTFLYDNANFITGSYNSTQVIAQFAPTLFPGSRVNTSDMGMMECDGVRWLVRGTPPIPPGAVTLGYSKNQYTCFPVQSEIVLSRGTSISRTYAGVNSYPTQPIAGSFGTDATTGQLALYYNQASNPSNPGVLTTMPSQNAASIIPGGNLGALPFAVGSKGFYFEAAYTIPTDNSDSFNAFFLIPQEHNTLATDSPGGTFPAGYEQWSEFDINENGHGTDQGGFERGAYVSWSGSEAGYNVTLTAAPSGTITSMTMTANWPGDTASHFTITTSTGQQINSCTLTNGSPTISFSSTTITGSPTTTLTTGVSNTIVNNSHTGSFSYTSEHIFGGAYDPVGKHFYVWVDGVLQDTLSTNVAGTTNTFRDSLHYYPIFQMASHGSNVAGTMLLRYFSLWTP